MPEADDVAAAIAGQFKQLTGKASVLLRILLVLHYPEELHAAPSLAGFALCHALHVIVVTFAVVAVALCLQTVVVSWYVSIRLHPFEPIASTWTAQLPLHTWHKQNIYKQCCAARHRILRLC